ncbi:hypothetical protein FHX42_002032 [Saccharopolyspora lacisalsi]|uniref:Uncharacterized protein n=1 Tax=Halosaccharopolyspora lacisalsi TaxID=1000566 RepID=A0A839DZ65_9PSEU|nr:hypothetical protein [Halosaccharopolyspora lacisalsi]
MAGLVRWLGGMSREMERGRAMMRHPKPREVVVVSGREQG